MKKWQKFGIGNVLQSFNSIGEDTTLTFFICQKLYEKKPHITW